MKNNHYYFILFFFFGGPLSIKAQDTLFYSQDQSVIDIGRFARFHIDAYDSLSLAQVQALPDRAFEKSKTEVMNFGNTTASIGIKLYIKNLTTEPLFLSFENSELQHIDILTLDEKGQQTVQQGGYYAPFANRYLQRGNAVLKIGTQPAVVYMKVKTHSSFYFPVNVSALPPLMDASYKRDVFKGVTLGIMLAMLFYNLFVFFLVRDNLYLYYCFYVVAGIYTYSHLNGLWFFTWSDYPFFNRFLGIQLLALGAAFFSFRFLNSKVVTPRLYRVMQGFVVVIILLIPIEYLDIQPFTNNFSQLFTALGAFVLFGAGIFAYLQGNKSAKYYVLAWVFFLFGSFITLLCFVGWVPYNFLTFNGSVIGACIENLMLSFALANRINIYRAESAQAQALAFQRLEENERLVREQNKDLEEKVHERTTELESSLDMLKTTQTQLIQAEKLASLGELTAGIAHEIQNPLNFVNNFSELSVGLVQDIEEEMAKPALDNAYIEELFTDLRENQEKINHHGKRASSIVKGMLGHSRENTGVRELTDLNKLADEYLRLSYHGLRAKDKNFNADFELIADPNLPTIKVIPQDFGRVLLNLINNAFYAVNEKKKKYMARTLHQAESMTEGSYQPTVTVTTQQLDNQILIKVRDNGTGMPESVKDKVFQPFFTTKPTGSGTGLGLSISYDIVTKGHGGRFDIETKEGEFTEFIIHLPMLGN
jgi:two-component system, NtrC family, sensor kinase